MTKKKKSIFDELDSFLSLNLLYLFYEIETFFKFEIVDKLFKVSNKIFLTRKNVKFN